MRELHLDGLKVGNIQINQVRPICYLGSIVNGDNTLEEIHKWHPFTNRPVGRPTSRWEDDVKNDLKKAESGKMVRPGPRST